MKIVLIGGDATEPYVSGQGSGGVPTSDRLVSPLAAFQARGADVTFEPAKTVADAVKRAETIEAPEVSDIFNWTFADIPEQIATQRDTMRTTSIGQDPSQIASEQATTKA